MYKKNKKNNLFGNKSKYNCGSKKIVNAIITTVTPYAIKSKLILSKRKKFPSPLYENFWIFFTLEHACIYKSSQQEQVWSHANKCDQ